MFKVRSSKGASFCPNTKSYLAHIASSLVLILNFPANDGSYKKKESPGSENEETKAHRSQVSCPKLPKLVVYVLLMFSSPL